MEPTNRRLIRPSLTEMKEQRPPRKESHGGAPPPKKATPPDQTNAENFYYLKQMQSKTPMTIVLRDGRPVPAIGGRGGRKIPNALFEVLTRHVGLGESLEAALAAPRPHTEGNLNLELEAKWPAAEVEALAKLGYKMKTAASATLSAAAFDPQTRECRAAMR